MSGIRPLRAIDPALAGGLITGYTSEERYAVTSTTAWDHLRFEGVLVPCDPPFVKSFPPPGPEVLARYDALAAAGHAFGAFDGAGCVGLAICEPTIWNRSLTLLELHVARHRRGRGIGRALVEAVAGHGRALRLRRVWLETQTTNAPAIHFYTAVGFTVVGLDLGLYDKPSAAPGEVALYMAQDLE